MTPALASLKHALLLVCAVCTLTTLSAGIALAEAPSPAPPAAPAAAPDLKTCEGCHASDPAARTDFPDGSFLSAFIAPGTVAHSVHGKRFGCVDCHREVGVYPHVRPVQTSAAEFKRAQDTTCARCHADHQDQLSDSIHARALAGGNAKAPGCVDCHGAHDVAAPGQSRKAVADLCGRCHEKQAAVFAKSVHAKAMLEGNPDVPACTDCHGAHAIADTQQAGFHAASYTLCAKCHGDAKLMEKYDLSPDILKTYLDDFHGSSNHLYVQVGYVPERPVATCADCHGYHDVQRVRGDEAAANVVRERFEAMCQKCHADAPAGFSAAWLAHQVPTLQAAPLVWGITWGYRVLIPLMILGLILHILLHLWHLPVKGV